MDWKAFIQEPVHEGGEPLAVSFHSPATEQALQALEREFSITLPEQLRELLLQTDGVDDEFDCPIVDGVPEIAAMNRAARDASHDHCMPLDHLFFVSSCYGNGDLVGYGLRRDRWPHPALFRWDHEDDSRTWLAPDLKTFLLWGFKGKKPDGDGRDETACAP